MTCQNTFDKDQNASGDSFGTSQDAAVKLMRTRIELLAQPKSMRSIISATQREQKQKWPPYLGTSYLEKGCHERLGSET